MSNAWTAAVVFLGPLVILFGFVIAGLAARRQMGAAAGPNFFARNGAPVAIFLIAAVGFWMFFLIVYPQLYMVDYSFHPKLPPSKRGGPEDFYTLENYRYFLYGSTRNFSQWNTTHLHAFWITIFVSMIITIVNFCVCYPLAYYMAQVAKPAVMLRLMLLLVIPYWVNEILRAFAFRVLLGTGGVINNVLIGLGLLHDPIDFLGDDVALYAGLTYAYLLIMMFPLYNALESLDRNQIEAARDLGAPWWHIHLFVVIPYAKPGVASGATLVFMLCAGALAAPLILGGPKTLWFTPIVYDRFFQAFNWPQGAAYALILLAACMVFVLLIMRLFRVSLSEIAR
jgi:spermidine/putrescine transport system permease protein